MSLIIKSTDSQKDFVNALNNAEQFNGFLLGTHKKVGPWKKNAAELMRQVTMAMADIDFDKLYTCGLPKKGDIYPLFTDNVLNKDYYGKKVWRVHNGKNYYIHTNAGVKAIYARIHTLANSMNLLLEIEYEPGTTVKKTENDDGTTSVNEEQVSSLIETHLNDLIEIGGKRQIILTGAPGTGKTYTAKRVAKEFIAQGNDFYTYYRDKGAKLVGSKVKDAVTKLLSDTTYREGACDGAALKEVYSAFDAAYVEEICKQMGSEEYGEAQFWQEVEQLRGRLAFVQFHPSYDYTDFVEGLRPVEKKTGEKSEMHFKRVDGSFMSFCRFVAWQNDRITDNLSNLYFFIIDEINRADLSKVLGELMFCLEEDKRGKENRVHTQYQNLKTDFPDLDAENTEEQKGYRGCFDTDKGGFFIPENVVIIGTMNDIDRSVTSMDFALRRRFVWEEVEVTEELLSTAFSGNERFGVLYEKEKENVRSNVISRIIAFNAYKSGKVKRLNKDFDISQGQFINLYTDELNLSEDELEDDKKTADAVMAWVWKYRVRSLMKEYLRGETAADSLLTDFEKAWLQ